jgi:large subunit ribosomal protein L29
MKRKDKENIRDQSADELKAVCRELTAEIFQMENELAIQRKLEKPHLLKAKKKERARVMTFLQQKSAS